MSKYSKKDIFINIEAVSKQTWHLKIILFEIKKTIRCMFNQHIMLYIINVNVYSCLGSLENLSVLKGFLYYDVLCAHV